MMLSFIRNQAREKQTDSCSCHLDVMPLCVLSEGAGPGTQVPAHLTRISIPLITSSTDCFNKTVKGKVIRKGPLVSLAADDFILKTVIQEEEVLQSIASINVVLFGALAKDFSQSVSQGDVVVASGFTVSKSPTVNKDKLHPCNLLLSGDDACLYDKTIPLPPLTDSSSSTAHFTPQHPSALCVMPDKSGAEL
ncbi:protection of telomeres protein 1 [Lates japonicus]|uniref:Protection of telomeres protein 1 n=1 Tax=Lates japonicus TaxID=270547 RepID=A0AAD3MWZ6_LATJO|nr:protection of telomeres protein 1 [Lates japonicus]